MSKKIAMLQIGGYNNYIAIPESIRPQGVFDLMTAQSFNKNYKDPWQNTDNVQVEIIFIHPSELPTPENQTTIDMQEIMDENNRLTRQNDRLLEKLAKLEASKSTDMAVVGGVE